MSVGYAVVKFLHVIGVIVWLGGLTMVTLMNARLARAEDAAALRVLSRQTELFGKAVLGPAAGLTLLSGFALMGLLREGFRGWMGWGLAVFVLSIAFGATFLRRANVELAALAATTTPDGARVAQARRRLGTLNLVNLVLLLSAVFVMVAKPGR